MSSQSVRLSARARERRRSRLDPGALLDRPAAYITTFQTDCSRVIGTERYNQTAHDLGWLSRTRQMQSDIFFVGTGDNSGAMTVRNGRRVDGRALPDASIGIDQAMALPPSRRVERLKALADLGARFNLGSLQRNFNDPTIPLMLAALIQQSRFRYTIEGPELVDDRPTTRLGFREVARPRLIHGRDGVSVPEAMSEDYHYRDKTRMIFVSGHAAYDDFRRFETTVRIVTP